MPLVSYLALQVKVKEQIFVFIVEKKNIRCAEKFSHNRKTNKQINDKRYYFGC